MILVSTQNFPPRIGGIETLVYSLCQNLCLAGEKIVVFADRQNHNSDILIDRELGFEVIRYSGIRPLRRRNKALAIVKYARTQVAGSAVLITDSWKSLELIDHRHFSLVVSLAHGSEISKKSLPLRRRRIRRSFLKADYIISNSYYTADLLKAFTSTEKIKTIYPGITRPHTDAATQEKIREASAAHNPIIITVARLEKRKGQQHIINIMPELLEYFPGLLYVIIGQGPERQNLETMATNLGITGNVLFLPELTSLQKNSWLAISTLFVMPGSIVGDDVEGFGMAYIEAACLGIPSVACNAGGAPEAVLNHQTGLISEPGDLLQLKSNIIRLLIDHDLRKELGKNAKMRSESFLWENKVHEYLDLLCRDESR